jgi:hypothetical protein
MEEAKHIATPGGWEGIHAAGFRKACIDACRLVNYKMTLAKLALHVKNDAINQDGEPIVRIYGQSEMHTAHTRNSGPSMATDVRSRPMYREWAIKLRVRFDADQFNVQDVYNLISRVGGQVGLCEGRPDSKSSAGCGFGTFEVVPNDRQKEVSKKFAIK